MAALHDAPSPKQSLEIALALTALSISLPVKVSSPRQADAHVHYNASASLHQPGASRDPTLGHARLIRAYCPQSPCCVTVGHLLQAGAPHYEMKAWGSCKADHCSVRQPNPIRPVAKPGPKRLFRCARTLLPAIKPRARKICLVPGAERTSLPVESHPLNLNSYEGNLGQEPHTPSQIHARSVFSRSTAHIKSTHIKKTRSE